MNLAIFLCLLHYRPNNNDVKWRLFHGIPRNIKQQTACRYLPMQWLYITINSWINSNPYTFCFFKYCKYVIKYQLCIFNNHLHHKYNKLTTRSSPRGRGGLFVLKGPYDPRVPPIVKFSQEFESARLTKIILSKSTVKTL